jgi:hypothetical protein
LDVHKFILLDTPNEKKWITDLYKRAKEQDVFGTRTLVPCPEDILFITLMYITRQIREKNNSGNILYFVLDCKEILDKNKDFNWNIIVENAKKTKSQVHINIAMKFLNKISTDIIPKHIQNNFLFEKETNKYSTIIAFKHIYFRELQSITRNIKLSNAITNPQEFSRYLKLKIKYKLLKLIYKSQLLSLIMIEYINSCVTEKNKDK